MKDIKNKIYDFFPFFLFLPSLTYLIFFIGYPTLQAVLLAFKDPYTGIFSLVNFKRLFGDYHFWEALQFTFLLAAVVIPLQVFLALIMALIINSRIRGYMTFLYIFAMPLAISDVAAGLIWYSILAPSGFLNKFLLGTGIIGKPMYFLGYAFRDREFLSIVVTEIWRATAIVFVIILAGLQTISKDFLEAAEVFGAGMWIKLKDVILPLLKPSLQAALLIRTLFAFQVFGVIWVLVGRDIPVLAGEAYYWQTEIRNPHISSAYALMIAAFSIIVSIGYISLLRPRVGEVT